MKDNLQRAETREPAPAWSAVVAVALGVFGLVTAEFLPASLLTPMAADLGITEGMAGQAVTMTAVVGLLTGLVISAATRRIDRRRVLLAFSVLLIVSNLMVAFAANLPILLVGRIVLGIALGGFWSMSAAVAMRLVPQALVPRALSIIFSGVSAATIFAAPVGSYLGEIAGWRAVFLAAAALAAISLVAQLITLPSMRPSGHTSLRTLGEVLARPGIGLGMFAVMLVFVGHFAFFTYIRPFLETVTRVDIGTVSAILLGFGVANFLGTFAAGPMIERNLRLTLLAMPLLMGLLGIALASLGNAPVSHAAMVAIWGLAFGAVPVAWSTWLTRTVPDQAESAGGLLVAAIQLAIAIGAAAGGAIFDLNGATGVFGTAGTVLLLAAGIIALGMRPRAAVATA